MLVITTIEFTTLSWHDSPNGVGNSGPALEACVNSPLCALSEQLGTCHAHPVALSSLSPTSVVPSCSLDVTAIGSFLDYFVLALAIESVCYELLFLRGPLNGRFLPGPVPASWAGSVPARWALPPPSPSSSAKPNCIPTLTANKFAASYGVRHTANLSICTACSALLQVHEYVRITGSTGLDLVFPLSPLSYPFLGVAFSTTILCPSSLTSRRDKCSDERDVRSLTVGGILFFLLPQL